MTNWTTQSYYHLIIEIAISEKNRVAKLWKQSKIWIKRLKGEELLLLFNVALKSRLVDINYNFECDWLIELSDSKLPYNNLASELVENGSCFSTNHDRRSCDFYDQALKELPSVPKGHNDTL